MAFFIAGALACQSHVFAQLSTTPEPDSSRWRSNYEDLSLACSARKVSVIDMKSQSGIHAKNETSFASPPRKASTESFRRPGGKPRSLENDSTEQEGSMAASQLKKSRAYGPDVCQEVVAFVPQHFWSHIWCRASQEAQALPCCVRLLQQHDTVREDEELAKHSAKLSGLGHHHCQASQRGP